MFLVCMLEFGSIDGLVMGSNEGKGEGDGNGEAKRGAEGGVETGGLQLQCLLVLRRGAMRVGRGIEQHT